MLTKIIYVNLPNGYCLGPSKFMKALNLPLSKLRLNKITITTYLGDCLNVDKKDRAYWENTKAIVNTFQNLRFTVQPEP